MMLNTLAGMPLTAQKHYNRAAKLWYDANVKHIPNAVKEYHEFAKIKIIRSGFQASVLSKNPALVGTDIISKARRVPGLGVGLRGMEQIGNFAEDVPRMALYFFGKDKGAAWLAKKGFKGERGILNYVRKFHPVYDEFTQFEQQFMRRAMPFYSWSRFNMPLHVEMFLNNPKHYVHLEKYRRAITEAAGGKLPEEFTPEWIKNSVAIGISARPGKRNYLIMKNWHPAADLVDLTSGDAMRRKLVNMLHPIKAVVEVAWGYDTFRGRKMPSVPGGKEDFYGMRLSPRVTHLFKTIRSVNEINRFWWGSDDPLWMRTLYAGMGRNYEIDIAQSKQNMYYTLSEMIQSMNSGIKNARYHKDYKTMRRLQRDVRVLEQSMKKYKPKGK